ncbi:DUF3021 family protein [Ligilactobacillus saerimneri]
MLKKAIHQFIIGTGFAAVAYLCLITAGIGPTTTTWFNTLSVLGLGGVIGLTSMLFIFDEYNFFFLIALHFITTVGIVRIMMLINNWKFSFETFVIIILIYIIIWVIYYIDQWTQVQRVNEALRKRR